MCWLFGVLICCYCWFSCCCFVDGLVVLVEGCNGDVECDLLCVLWLDVL